MIGTTDFCNFHRERSKSDSRLKKKIKLRFYCNSGIP